MTLLLWHITKCSTLLFVYDGLRCRAYGTFCSGISCNVVVTSEKLSNSPVYMSLAADAAWVGSLRQHIKPTNRLQVPKLS